MSAAGGSFRRRLLLPHQLRDNGSLAAGFQALSAFFYGLGGVLATSTIERVSGVALTLGGALALLLSLAVALRRRNGLFQGREAEVAASPERGLEVDGRVYMAPSAIRAADLTRRDGRAIARVRGAGWRRVELRVANEAEGEELLRALGVSEAERVVDTPARTLVGPAVFRVAATLVAAFSTVGLSVWSLLVATHHVGRPPVEPIHVFGVVMLVTWVIATLPGELRVGRDGVASQRVAGRGRFLSFAEVDAVTCTKGAIHVTKRDGKRVELEELLGVQVPAAEREAIARRIDAALRAYREGRGDLGAVEPLVARGTQTASEWLTRLAQLARGDGPTYRGGPPPTEQLLRVVEDVGAHATARAGAAILLARVGDGEAIRRVRVAAGASASPKLRVALERVVEAREELQGAALERRLHEAVAEMEVDAPDAPPPRTGASGA